MAYRRTAIRQFSIANSAYRNATVSFFKVDATTLQASTDLITLFSAPSGASVAVNPYTLDATGKFSTPLYTEEPTIASVTQSAVGAHSTGIIYPDSGGWRGDWASDTDYLPGEFIRDGADGADTGNVYAALAAHHSGVWLTDLANGLWALAIPASVLNLGSQVTGILGEANGGTGAATYAQARTLLGLAIGSDVQAFSSNLLAFSSLTPPSSAMVGISDLQVLTNKTINASNNTISNLTTAMFAAGVVDTDPTLAAASATRLAAQSAIKSYIDNLITGLKWKQSVKAMSSTNVNIASAPSSFDGVSPTSGDRIALNGQSTGSQNGIYLFNGAGAAMTRALDADSGAELVQATFFVEQGTALGDTQWTCTNNTITLGSTSVVFAQVSGAGSYSADAATLQLIGNQFSIKDAELLAIAGLVSAADKLAYFTGSGTAALADLSAFARTLLDDANASAMRTTLGAQTLDSELTAIAGLVSATDKIPYFTGSGAAALADFTSFARTLTACADAAAVLAALGVTSGSTVSAPDGRLTLTTSTPITSTDVIAATTIYFTQYKGSTVWLFNGTTWSSFTLSETSQATTDNTKSPAATSANKNYDMFLWDDSGTLRCTRGPAWSSDNARGTGAGTTELISQDGFIVNKIAITNGPAAKRGLYVGTIRTTAANQVEDSYGGASQAGGKRYVWNMYNRLQRSIGVIDTTDSWTYTTATFRQSNAATGNKVEFVLGLSEDMVEAVAMSIASNTGALANAASGIGLDSTTASSAQIGGGQASNLSGLALPLQLSARYQGFPSIGYHALNWLEISAATGTTTWFGDNGQAYIQSGLQTTISA